VPPAPVELPVDCVECLLEGGAVEIYDPLIAACRFGIPSEVVCRLCGTASRGVVHSALASASNLLQVAANACPFCRAVLDPQAIDHHRCTACGAQAALEHVASPTRFQTVEELGARIDAWAREERFPSRDKFLEATFVTPSVAEIFDSLLRRARIETVVDPFGSRTSTQRSGEQTPAEARPRPTPKETAPITERIPSAPPYPPLSTFAPLTIPPDRPSVTANRPQDEAAPPSAPPRSIVYPLVSVIAADGEVHPGERAIVDKFLASEGLAPLSDEECKVHAPADVAHLIPREKREAVIQLMCETAMIDGLPDASELRVIRAYAAAWNVPDEKLELWIWAYENANSSAIRQLWLKIRRFVLSARWEGKE